MNSYRLSYFVISCVVLALIVSILILYSTTVWLRPDKTNRALVLLTIGCFVAYSIEEIMVIVIYMNNQEKHCYFRLQVSTFSYAGSKLCMYFLLIQRVSVSFRGASFGYSSTIINLLFVFIGGTMTLFFVVGIFVVENKPTRLSQCTFSGPRWYLTFFAVIDFAISALCLFMFLRYVPFSFLFLFLLERRGKKTFERPLNQFLQEKNDMSLKEVAIKYAILTSTAILSSFVATLLVAFQTDLFHVNRIDDVEALLKKK
ncbi:hypothetical protein RFI_08917 [Reticulomyxa filosa]|uniref:Uncharacterized protein n=1 Tax=Reticulomyxa filosa TaxID=46433 RepID=X6NPJ8_RETFI|nr:hypothetical protein RFI_08917 [Reticulomyxa filosa]|eukprot:ETO28215.1 hypothetical protein RFI_08917 [Reticulomyxa filosa]